MLKAEGYSFAEGGSWVPWSHVGHLLVPELRYWQVRTSHQPGIPQRMQQTWLGEWDGGGCRTRPALGLSTTQEVDVVLYHMPSRVGGFYRAVLSAILSRVGGCVVNA